MKSTIKAIFGFLVTFLIADIAFITLFAQQFYENQVGDLLRKELKLGFAVVFYLVYACIAVKLVVLPSTQAAQAAKNGALLGLVAYGTYTFTNYAMLEGWTMSLVCVDVFWGISVTALCCFVGYRASR